MEFVHPYLPNTPDQKKNMISAIGLSSIEEYMILSMELPSEMKDLKNAVFPDVFIVDYVKVYKKK